MPAIDRSLSDCMYDAAVSGFVRKAHASSTPWFFYFCSHHTHVAQFATKGRDEMTGWSESK